jgi:hypothetical protein
MTQEQAELVVEAIDALIQERLSDAAASPQDSQTGMYIETRKERIVALLVGRKQP